MSLDSLYQDILLDHFKHPRNHGAIPDGEALVDEENPTCGDHIRLTARVENGRLKGVQFDGKGCVISTASASMMTDAVDGKTPDEALALARDVIVFLRGEGGVDAERLGDLASLEGVKQFPLRVKCATLAWHALEKALAKRGASRP